MVLLAGNVVVEVERCGYALFLRSYRACFFSDLYNNIPGQKNHGLWVNLYVPADRAGAPPGRYSGKLSVHWKGGQDHLNIALDVWDFALPHESHLKGDIWNGSMRQMPPEQELLYYQLARQHRFHPLIYAYRPKLNVSGTKVSLDLDRADQRISRYLDGSAFTGEDGYWGPGYGVPVSHMMLPFDIEKGDSKTGAWPIALPEEGRTRNTRASGKEGRTPGSDAPGQQARVAASNESGVPQWP